MGSRQQTLWDWAEESSAHNLEEIRPKVKGKLNLTELPPAPAREMFAMIRHARSLHVSLESHLGKLDLFVTNNRRRMLSARKKKTRHSAHHVVRLHHMFLGGEDELVAQIAGFIRGEERAREQIQHFIHNNRESISHDVELEQLQTLGKFHDLEWIFAQASALLGDHPTLDGIRITWGKRSKGKRSIRLGSYDFEQRLVRIHPALDQRWVPTFFVEYIIYHELLHALYPPTDDGTGRRSVHTEEFKLMEERYPYYKEALAWESEHIHRILGA